MAKRYFKITVTHEAMLELDDAVIDTVDDEWRKKLYNLNTPEEIAQMIGENMIRGMGLSGLDGWADQPDENAHISIMGTEVEAEEIEPKDKK